MRARDRVQFALALGLLAPPAGLAVSAGPALWVPFCALGPALHLARVGIAYGLLPTSIHDPLLALVAAAWIVAVVVAGIRAGRAPDRGVRQPLWIAASYFAISQGLSLGASWVLERVDVEGVSMAPTFLPGQDVLVAIGPAAGPPQPGDVVLYRGPVDGSPWIKRVIAAGGQRVSVEAGVVVVDGVPVGGPAPAVEVPRDRRCAAVIQVPAREEVVGVARWVSASDPASSSPVVEVPPGHLLLFGDNRPASYDSRRHGPVPVSDVLGVARGPASARSACGWW